jgi:hypothetical protein
VVCLTPRAPKEIVRPRRLSDVVGRPLNVTVRHLCETRHLGLMQLLTSPSKDCQSRCCFRSYAPSINPEAHALRSWSVLLILQCIGNVSGGRWSTSAGLIFAVLGVALVWSIALAVPPRSLARRNFRRFALIFLASVVFFWVLFTVLDTFHVPWRQYWR